MNGCTFVIMGATGDLCKKKIIPAIYHLIKDKKIKKFAIVGAAITKTTFEKIVDQSKKFITEPDKKIFAKIKSAGYYCELDFYNKKDFSTLNNLVLEAEKKHKLPKKRIFYLATLPKHFITITKHLGKIEIGTPIKKRCNEKCWPRIVYEKPFGENLASSKKINSAIKNAFKTSSSTIESHIYRIDHYLWKELVSNIVIVRFTNLFFEPLWNKKYIKNVQIILDENLGLGDRGNFYDSYGAIKDVVQNHMLQMLALIAMEPPKKLESSDIRDAKAKLLKAVEYKDALLGQFAGYKKTKGVSPQSKKETFAALALTINNKRWNGVPFFLKTGKMLSRKETAIHIEFKKPSCLQKQCAMHNNVMSIIIQPAKKKVRPSTSDKTNGFYLKINAKTPGQTFETTSVDMNFCHVCKFGPNSPRSYEALLQDILLGDHSAFVRFDEIEASWKIVETILRKKHTLYTYKKGSDGPKELKTFSKKHSITWL